MSSEVEVYIHLVKIIHLFNGIYIWEFFTTLGFEWEVFTGKRPWKWSFAVYLTARILALTSVICNLLGFNLKTQFNCNAWFRCVLVSSWFSVAIASFLLVLRGIAIWGRHKVITAVAVSFWFANLSIAFYSSTKAHSVWVPAFGACVITKTNSFRWSVLINLFVDLSLLCIMFLGVLHKKNATYLWRMLYLQSIFWILTAISTELPAVILPFINMNDAWNLMFQVPHMVLVVIMSTRLYRDLFQYITKYALQPDNSGYLLSTVLLSDHDPFGRRRPNVWQHQNVQVAVHKTVEYDVDLRRFDEERAGLGEGKQTITVRSQAELELHTAELQMKKDLQI
ncbi:hypothetical protein B0F90DRAFT_1818556 [Multifurca ochricompacta]|uniref:Uncharacterized protein n=1 Tax=Multifurca ochricompacta TaxID=376703 RepID=A0AAD4M283_9AGAM|nr:hypothetical protein B0F90DRAFT_1818556 [Multifurca ochricompacta]